PPRCTLFPYTTLFRSMLDRRCARVAAVRLPFATRTIIEKDRPGGIGNFALSSARRSRNRLDEQAPRLSIARRRDGHGRSKRKTRSEEHTSELQSLAYL